MEFQYPDFFPIRYACTLFKTHQNLTPKYGITPIYNQQYQKTPWRNLFTPTRFSEYFDPAHKIQEDFIYSKVLMTKISLKCSSMYYLYETSLPKCPGNTYTITKMTIPSTSYAEWQKKILPSKITFWSHPWHVWTSSDVQ